MTSVTESLFRWFATIAAAGACCADAWKDAPMSVSAAADAIGVFLSFIAIPSNIGRLLRFVAR